MTEGLRTLLVFLEMGHMLNQVSYRGTPRIPDGSIIAL